MRMTIPSGKDSSGQNTGRQETSSSPMTTEVPNSGVPFTRSNKCSNWVLDFATARELSSYSGLIGS